MIITHIEITNFRGIRALSADTLPRTLILGHNRSGKTSLLDAIRAVFIGRVVDNAGKALEVGEWIGPHGRTAMVQIAFTLADGAYVAKMQVARTVSMTIQPPGGRPTWTGSPRDVRGTLWRHMGVHQRHIECAMIPRQYLLGDDLGKLITDLGGGTVDAEALNLLLGQNATWFAVECDRTGVRPTTVDNLLSVGAAMFGRRTDAKSRLSDINRRLSGLINFTAPLTKDGLVMTPEMLGDAKQARQRLHDSRDGLLRELGQAQAPSVDIEAARAERAGIDLDALSCGLHKLKSQRDAAREDQYAARSATEAASANHAGAMGGLRDAMVALKAAETGLSAVPERVSDGDECPSCGQPITEKILKRIRKPLVDAVDEATRKRDEAAAQAESILKQIEPLRAALAEAEAIYADAKREYDESNVRYSTLTARAADLDSVLERPVKQTISIEDLKQEIITVDERIRAADAAIDALSQIAERTGITIERDALEAEIELLSWAIPLFHNDRKSNHASALNAIGRNQQDEFVAGVNAVLKPFGARISLDTTGKSVQVMFGDTDGGTHVSIAQASGAEMLLAEYAVAKAFSADGIVLLDEFTRLDGRYRPLMIAALCESDTPVWAACAYSQPNEPDVEQIRVAMDPVGVVWVGEGNG